MTFTWRYPSATERQTCDPLILGIIDTSYEQVSVQVPALGQSYYSGWLTVMTSMRWSSGSPASHRILPNPTKSWAVNLATVDTSSNDSLFPIGNVYRDMRTYFRDFGPLPSARPRGSSVRWIRILRQPPRQYEFFSHFTFRILFRNTCVMREIDRDVIL